MNLNKILYVPLDLPVVPKDLSLENIAYTFVPENSVNEIEELKLKRKHHLYAWNSFIIRSPKNRNNESYSSQLDDIEWEYTIEASKQCPNLIKYIETYLPYNKFKFIAAISSRGEVPMHFDHTESIPYTEQHFYKANDPCYYRILLDGSINDKSFYIYTKKLGKQYCSLPSDSPGWAMGSYSCAHGNDESLTGQKLLLYVMGDLDLNRHHELICRSFNKFQRYAIVKEYD